MTDEAWWHHSQGDPANAPFGCNCRVCKEKHWPDEMIPQETLHTDWTGSATYQEHQRTIVESATGGKKGTKQARFDLLDQGFLWSLAEVCGFGAGIYGDNNWRKGYDWSLSYAALMRHLSRFLQGEDLDEESGMPHISHVAWHAMVLYVFSTDGLYREYDTRGEQG